MYSTHGQIHLQSSCQRQKFIWSERRFPRTLPPQVKFTGNFSSRRSKYVTGGGFNIHEVPPLIQNLTAEKLADVVKSTGTCFFQAEQAPGVTDCVLVESTQVLVVFLVMHIGFRKHTIVTTCHNCFYTNPYKKANTTSVLTLVRAALNVSNDKSVPAAPGKRTKHTKRSVNKAIRVVNFVVRWRRVISFTLRPLAPV